MKFFYVVLYFIIKEIYLFVTLYVYIVLANRKVRDILVFLLKELRDIYYKLFICKLERKTPRLQYYFYNNF